MASTFTILVGSHTYNVYTLHFSPSSDSDALKVVSRTNIGYHPTYLVRHPTVKDRVITTIEQEAGELAVLKVDYNGAVQVVQKVGCGGLYPCFVMAVEDKVFATNVSCSSLMPNQYSIHLNSSSVPRF